MITQLEALLVDFNSYCSNNYNQSFLQNSNKEKFENSLLEFASHYTRIENDFIRHKSEDLFEKLKNIPEHKKLEFEFNELINIYKAHSIYEHLHQNNHKLK